jgi:hydroxymethylpyrimidine pyrophosphatase-like HAD family hydrolase
MSEYYSSPLLKLMSAQVDKEDSGDVKLFDSSKSPKTIFCDIDGTLLKHTGDIVCNYNSCEVLDGVLSAIKQWEKNNYKIILTTGRKESIRAETEKQLKSSGIVYDQLIMGLPNGYRVLINDKKPNSINNTAYAINLSRNKGMTNVDLTSKNITIKDNLLFNKNEKPWGYEELVECNDKYIVKKLFMKKGHCCSIQYHELKTETIIVLNGKLNIYTGTDKDNLSIKVYSAGETITITPYTIHRMEAVEDSLYIECSTNELWDVVRISDKYNRS